MDLRHIWNLVTGLIAVAFAVRIFSLVANPRHERDRVARGRLTRYGCLCLGGGLALMAWALFT